MTRFIFQRLLTLMVSLFCASMLIMLVLEVLPGNAAQVMLGTDASPEAVQALEVELGLDQGLAVRYGQWVQGLLTGELGDSYTYGSPVSELIAERMAVTLPLAVMAMALTLVVALAAGMFAASRHNKAGDIGVMTLTQLGMAVPNFWFAIVLVLVFAVQLRWFSAGGFPGWTQEEGGGFWLALKALLLPALALAVVQAAILARMTRSAFLEQLGQDYVRTAKSKGLSLVQIMWRHVLRNALIPILVLVGLQFANLLAGTIVVENVFSLPGIGRLIFQSIANRDMIVIRNCVMWLVLMVLAVNFVVDVVSVWIDPRLKVPGGHRG